MLTNLPNFNQKRIGLQIRINLTDHLVVQPEPHRSRGRASLCFIPQAATRDKRSSTADSTTHRIVAVVTQQGAVLTEGQPCFLVQLFPPRVPRRLAESFEHRLHGWHFTVN